MIDEKKLIEDFESIKSTCEHLHEIIFFDGVMGVIDNQPKVDKWIPCSDRLPEKDGNYLTVTDECKMPDITLFANGNFIDFLGEEDNSIIAWQPLPEPYKGE